MTGEAGEPPFYVALVGAVVGLSFFANGAVDLWTQTLLHFFLIMGVSAALWFRPLPLRELTLWFIPLATLVFSAAFSGAPSVSQEAVFLWLDYFLLFVLAGSLGEGERQFLKKALTYFTWLLALAALCETALQKHPPHLTLLNSNILAGYFLLLIFLAMDRYQTLRTPVARLQLMLVFMAFLLTRSVGAVVSLCLAGLYWAWRTRGKDQRAAQAASRFFLIALVALAALQIHRGMDWHRIGWWQGAWTLIRLHPVWGLGPGTYELGLSFMPLHLRTWFAHNIYLQWAAEGGLVTLAALLFLIRHLFRQQTNICFAAGLLAVLIHNMIDYSLAIPAMAFLFWAFMAIGRPPRAPAPAGCKVPAFLCLSILWSTAAMSISHFKADRHYAQAAYAFESGATGKGNSLLDASLQEDPQSAKPYALRASMLYNDAVSRRSKAEMQETLAWILLAIQKEPINAQYWRNGVRIASLGNDLQKTSSWQDLLNSGKAPKHAAF